MPEKGKNILKYNAGEKSMKVLFIIYADMESSLEKIDKSYSNPEKLSTTKINKHTALLIFMYFSFNTAKNKHDYYRGKHCMKSFYKDLKKHATKLIIYENKRNDTINK